MPRKFLDDVRADIQTLIADNTTGEIQPADVRSILTDIVDSTIQDECAISGDTGATIALTSAFSPITDGFDTTVGGDGTWLKPNQATGTIVLNVQPGWTYSVLAVVTLQVVQNESLEFCILRDGVAGFFKPTIAGAGVSRPNSVQLIDQILANTSNEEVQIGVRAIDGAASVDIIDVVLEVTVLPTNNP